MLLLLLLIVPTLSLAKQELSVKKNSTFILNEKYLRTYEKKGSATHHQLALKELGIKLESSMTSEMYSPYLFASTSYFKTDEEPFSASMPVYSPEKSYTVGVKQKLKYGMDLTGTVGTNVKEYKVAGVGNKASVGFARIDLSVDLWKNLFGKVDRAHLQSKHLAKENAKLQRKVDEKNFVLQLRNLYWHLVANSESLKISERLLQTSLRQLTEAQKRYRSSVADKGEVARNKSQVATRRASIVGLKYKRERYESTLKELVPELLGKNIILEKYDIDKTISEVLSCAALINGQSGSPKNYTLYDDMINNIDKRLTKDIIVANSHSGMDIKLISAFKGTGIDQSAGEALDEALYEDRKGYEIGLSVVIPLGTSGRKSEKTKLKIAKRRHGYQSKQLLAGLESRHNFIQNSLKYLFQAIEQEKESSKNLKIRLKDVERKYRQARISISELIYDQDALLVTELKVIELQRTIVETLLSYFSIYTDIPCSFNEV